MRTVLLVIAALALAGCSGVKTRDVSDLPSGSLSDPGSLEHLGEVIEEGGEFVLHVEKGRTIPLVVDVALPFATLVAGHNGVHFTQDVYLLMSPEEFLISPDGERWGSFGDVKAVKSLFGVKGGTMSLGFEASRDAGARMRVSIHTHGAGSPPEPVPPERGHLSHEEVRRLP